MKSFLKLAVLFCLFTCSLHAADGELTDAQLADCGKAGTALVEIGQQREFGSAFCVDAQGYFLTNYHVVEHAADTVKLIVAPGEKSQKIVTAKVVRKDPKLDLALVHVSDATGVSAVALGTDNGLSEVQEVIAFGFPFGKDLALNDGEYPSISVNKGRITAMRRKDGKLNRIQIDAVLNPGNSGGPVINRKGEVIGVVVSGVLGAGAVNFAIPASHVREFLQRPEIEVVAPQLTAKSIHDEAELRVKVSGFFKTDYTVELTVINDGGTHVLKPSGVDKGAVSFRFVPVPADPNPTVELSAAFATGSIAGRVGDQSVSIGGRNLKLSEILRMAFKDNPQVVLATGEKITGSPQGLGVVKIALGDVSPQIDLSKASVIEVKRSAGAFCSYSVAVRYDGGSQEVTGKLGSGEAPVAAATAEATEIKPLQMDADRSELKLPSTITDLVVGGGGRFIILQLGKLHKLAVFDANKGEIAKYISVPDNILFAAGRDKLIVLSVDNNVIQRYSLDSFEREISTQSPIPGVVKCICMGSGSDGPLLMSVSPGTSELDRGTYHLLDIQRMKASPLQPKPMGTMGDPLMHVFSYRDIAHFRASSDGSVFGVWCTSHSPSGVGSVVLSGMESTSYYDHNSAGHVVPSFDGSQILTQGAIYSNEIKKLNGNYQTGLAYLPSPQSAYFIGVTPASIIPNEQHQKKDLYVFGPGDSRPLVTVPNIGDAGKVDPWAKNDFTFDKRFHLLTKSNLIVTIPEQNDRLVLHRFNLLDALKSADVDYLFVSSTPPRTAAVDQLYLYKIAVESKSGEVKFTLDSGPVGMTISPTGELKWTPKNEDAESGVIVRISDKSGQEVFHSFSIKVH